MIAAMKASFFSPFAALVCALCLPLSAGAQQSPQAASAPPPAEEPGFTWALGLAASNGPDYAGSDKRGSNLRPVIGLDIGRYTISSGGGGSLLDFDLEPRYTGVSARLLDADRLKLSAGLRIGGGRTSDADSPLYGLPDVRKTLRARLSASWLFSPELSLRSSLNQDLLGRKGGTTCRPRCSMSGRSHRAPKSAWRQASPWPIPSICAAFSACPPMWPSCARPMRPTRPVAA